MNQVLSEPIPGLLKRQAAELRDHMRQCRAQQSRWQLPAEWAERIHEVMAPRFVTTVLVVGGLLSIGLGWV